MFIPVQKKRAHSNEVCGAVKVFPGPDRFHSLHKTIRISGFLKTGLLVLQQARIIAFDLDDTLWPCMPVIRRAEVSLYQWLAEHYPRITEALDPEQMVESRREFTARDRRYSIDLTGMRRDFLHYLGERFDYDGRQVAEAGFDVFFHARQQVEFYDDVMPALEQLATRFRLGAISNGNASVEHVGLGDLFEHSVSATEVMAAKPDPLIYRHLAERFQADPQEIVYVGDHPHYDVVGAEDAGYQAVWINREAAEWPDELRAPRHQVTDLSELVALFDEA